MTFKQTAAQVQSIFVSTCTDFKALVKINNILDELEADYATASCANCKWLKEGVCVNDESIMCADYPDPMIMCNKWEHK